MTEKKKQGKRKRRYPGILLTFCFGALFLLSLYKILPTLFEEKEASDAYRSLRTEVWSTQGNFEKTTDAPTQKREESMENDSEAAGEYRAESSNLVRSCALDFTELQSGMRECAAWLTLEGTVIDYPVMHTDNNDYYLNHLYNGEWNSSGSLFMDYRNKSIETDKNVVIYGHHMKNGSMFKGLMQYKSQAYFEENPTMILYAPEGDYLIELFAGTIEDGDVEFVRFAFEDDADFLGYVDDLRSRSTFQSSVTITENDRIISLCTCSYENENARFMVTGKLIPLYVVEKENGSYCKAKMDKHILYEITE